MTFEKFVSKRDENIKENHSLIEYLTQEYSEYYLKLKNNIESDETLKAVKIKREILITLLQEKQDILSNLRYDNYEITLKALEEKEEQIYRQFCILRNTIYKKDTEKLKSHGKSEAIFDNIKYRQKSKSFMKDLSKCKCWIANHSNMALTLSLIIGAFISITYFFRISYFPHLDTASIFYYLVVITIVGTFFTFCFCLFFVLLTFLLGMILEKIKYINDKMCIFFIFMLLIQLLFLIFLPYFFHYPTIVNIIIYFASAFIFPLSIDMLKRLNFFHLKDNQDSLEFYILLFLFGFCFAFASFFAIFIPTQTGIITDCISIIMLSIGLLFLFCSIIVLLMQEKFISPKANVWVFAVTFLYFAFCLSSNIFNRLNLGNYQLESLTLDKQAKGFINKNCLQRIKQNSTDDIIVIDDIKVLLNIGEEYRLEVQCDDKKIQFSVPSRFIRGKQEVIKINK